MDEKIKKKKRLKQKQKQRQKQNQTVIVNVHSGKSTRSPSKPDKPRAQIPPPINKLYVTPTYDLTPQMFNKEGKQSSQPTLSEQIEKYLESKEQTKQVNVLGVAEVISEPEYSDKKQIPDEFNREQMLLRPSQSMYSENRYQPLFNSRPETLFDTPRPPEQPLNANTNRTKKKSKKGSKLVIEENEE